MVESRPGPGPEEQWWSPGVAEPRPRSGSAVVASLWPSGLSLKLSVSLCQSLCVCLFLSGSLLVSLGLSPEDHRDATTALPDLGRDSAAALPDLRRAGPGSGPGPEVQWRSLSRSSLTQSEIVSQRTRQTPENLDLIILIASQTNEHISLQYFLILLHEFCCC